MSELRLYCDLLVQQVQTIQSQYSADSETAPTSEVRNGGSFLPQTYLYNISKLDSNYKSLFFQYLNDIILLYCVYVKEII